jgi:hypothetical protein
MTARSVRTRKRATCWLPPLGARIAASTMSRMSAIGIGSGRKRRMARWVKMASDSGMLSREVSTAGAFISGGPP